MNLDELNTLSALKYAHSQRALSELLVQEARLRGELDRLRALVRETHAQPGDHAQIRAIGGDVIWLKWIGKAQRELNMSLAQLLAQKEGLLALHKQAHGRHIVARKLAQKQSDDRRKARQDTQLDAAIRYASLRGRGQ